MPRPNRFICVVGFAIAFVWIAGPGIAQTRAPLPPQKPSHQIVPQEPGSGGSSEMLSDKLDRQGGVIKPPADIDSGLAKAPPQTGSETTPVIPPPGTPGGKPGINPK